MARKKRKRKHSEGANMIARLIVDTAMDEGKNPAAVVLGRLGGLKGGPARAKNLSAKRRKAIAKKAAQARWQRSPR